ncbi:serine protease [Myxococcota bacterium]|nr:serine protease [Myxococcota bacterium]
MLTLSLLITIGGAAAAAPDPADVQAWLDAVVLIETGASLCAGTIIDERGTIATAYHCVASGWTSRVTTRDGREARALVLNTSPRDDLALLSAPTLAGSPWRPIAEDPASPGEVVIALGHPQGAEADRRALFEGVLTWSVSLGVVSAVGPRLIQVDAPLNPGSSGGPILNEAGELVGVVSRKLRGEGLGFVTPAALLWELLEDESPRQAPGGLYGAGLQASLPTSADVSPTVGVYGELSVRDRLVLRVDGSVAPDARWTALSSGQAWWPAASTSLGGRVRVGSGAYSTSLELGAGITVYAGRSGMVTEERLYTLPQPPQAVASATARASMGGVGLRWTILPWPDGSWGMLVGVDLERPGNVGVY